MAVVFSYPKIDSGDLQSADRLLISQMNVNGNPTKSVTLAALTSYIRPTPYIPPADMVTGSGTTNRLTKWKAPVGSSEIQDSGIEDTGSLVNVPYALNINNATSNSNGIIFPHPAGGGSGVVNMYYAGAAAGSRFVISRAATGGAEIELETDGDINLNRTGNGGVLIGNLQSFADDAAAGAAGVITNKLYQTDGTGAAPLNVAGIIMIKQ